MASLEKEIKKDEKKVEKFFKNKANIWMSVSILLIIVLIAVIFWPKGNISANAAGTNLVTFLNENVVQGGGVTLKSVTTKGDLYEVTVLYQGREIPVYTTKDGKYFISGITEITSSNSGNQDDTNPPAQEVPKTDKPVVELFVMSYCPFGTQNEKGLLPVMNLLKDKINVEIKFVNYTMHGQKEANENTIQYCIQKEQTSKFLPYLACFLNASDSPGCLVKVGINGTKLDACIASTTSQFQISPNSVNYLVNNADNIKYGIRGSPSLVVNGVEVQARSPAAILKYVCDAFNNAPAECSQQLDSAMPSAGFGYATSSEAASAAQCG